MGRKAFSRQSLALCRRRIRGFSDSLGEAFCEVGGYKVPADGGLRYQGAVHRPLRMCVYLGLAVES
jgi:hypothetical protein